MNPGKATHEQLKRHNRQMLLRAIYTGLADNRAALAQATGLAKPTVSDLIAEFIDEGLVAEGGHGESTDSGGKRPRLLEFVPGARQVIGISLDLGRVQGVLTNLNGRVMAQHHADLGDVYGESAVSLLGEVINGLVAQLDAPMLCLGVGVPGTVDSAAGVVRDAAELHWRNLPLGEILSGQYDVPAYVGNNTELTAMAQFSFSLDNNVQNVVTVRINTTVEVGMALGGAVYHHGGDVGCLQMGSGQLDTLVGWSYLAERAAALRRQFPKTMLPVDELTYLHINFAAANGDPAALQLYDELSDHLAHMFAWIVGLLRPDHIALAGPIVDLGQRLLISVAAKTHRLFQMEAARAVTFSLADSANLSAIGAVAQALQKELGIL